MVGIIDSLQNCELNPVLFRNCICYFRHSNRDNSKCFLLEHPCTYNSDKDSLIPCENKDNTKKEGMPYDDIQNISELVNNTIRQRQGRAVRPNIWLIKLSLQSLKILMRFPFSP